MSNHPSRRHRNFRIDSRNEIVNVLKKNTSILIKSLVYLKIIKNKILDVRWVNRFSIEIKSEAILENLATRGRTKRKKYEVRLE